MLVDIDIQVTGQWIATTGGIVDSRRNIVTALACDRQRPDPRGLVTNPGVTNGVERCRDRLHNRSRARLFIDIVAEVALTQRLLLEITISTRDRITAEQLNTPLFPTACQS